MTPTPAAVAGLVADKAARRARRVQEAAEVAEIAARDGAAAEVAVARVVEDTGTGPTWTELRAAMGWPRNASREIIPKLLQAGWLASTTEHRSLRPGPRHTHPRRAVRTGRGAAAGPCPAQRAVVVGEPAVPSPGGGQKILSRGGLLNAPSPALCWFSPTWYSVDCAPRGYPVTTASGAWGDGAGQGLPGSVTPHVTLGQFRTHVVRSTPPGHPSSGVTGGRESHPERLIRTRRVPGA